MTPLTPEARASLQRLSWRGQRPQEPAQARGHKRQQGDERIKANLKEGRLGGLTVKDSPGTRPGLHTHQAPGRWEP